MMTRRTRKGGQGGAASLTTISHLPFTILVEIFLKVTSLHSLVCCSSVCRSWRIILLSQEFTKTHFSQSKLFLVLASRETFDSISKKLTLISAHPNPQLDQFMARVTLNLNTEGIQIADSCNGFLCLTSPISIQILNPLTGECISIPSPDSFNFDPVHYDSAPTRLGISSNTNECKVVRIVPYCFLNGGRYCGLEIYTIGKGVWRYRKNSRARWVSGSNVFLNGNVVWFHHGHGLYALSFDDEEIHTVSLPEVSFNNEELLIGVLDGCLCVYKQQDIWVMKEYGNQASWMKRLMMCEVNIGVNYRSCVLLERSWVWCVHGTDTQQYARMHEDIVHVKSTYPEATAGRDVAVSYIPSFVSLKDFIRRK